MTRWSLPRLLLTLATCALAWALLAALCLCVGSTGVGLPTRFQLEDRLGPVLLASLVGAALASAGVTYQAILRNPLADPYLLGASSGAALATYLWALPFAASISLAGTLGQQAFSFAGSVLAVGAVFAFAQRRGRMEPVSLLLVGVIVNAINGSVFLLLYHLNLGQDQTQSTGGPFRFLVGSIQTNLTTQQIAAATACAVTGWCVLLLFAGELNVALLGESEAEALGVRVNRLRWVGIGVASLVTAAAVSVSGPIGFIGLVCPHVARLLVGSDQRRLLPVATALGAGLLAMADAASRGLLRSALNTQLPVGVLTGLLGGPFFLLILRRR